MPRFIGISKDKSTSKINVPETGIGRTTQKQKDFIPFDPQREGYLGRAGRNIAGIGQSVAGTLAGLPGSLATGISTGAGYLAKKAHETFIPTPEGVDPETWNKLAGTPVTDPDKLWSPGLTIEGVKDHISNVGEMFGISPEYWKPQTPAEEGIRNYTESVTALMHPLLFPVSGLKALTAPIVGTIGKKAAEALGFGTTGQAVAGGIGEAAFLGWNPRKFAEIEKKLYKLGEKAIGKAVVRKVDPRKIDIHSLSYDKYVNNPRNLTVEESWIKKQATGFEFNENTSDIRKIWKAKQSFNDHVNQFVRKDTGDYKKISEFIDDTNNIFDRTLKQYGKKHNPEFLKAYKESEIINNGLNNMPRVINTLNRAIEKRGDLIGPGLLTGYITLGTLGKALVGMNVAKSVVEGISMIKNSPAIVKYWAKGIAASSKQSLKSAVMHFEKADKLLEKKFPGVKKAISGESSKVSGGVKFLGIAK